jgi:hypothetical protein
LQHRLGQRHDGAGAPAFGKELLDELEPRNLVRRIDAVAEAIAQRRRKFVAALPHVELLAAQAGDSDDLPNVQRVARVARSGGHFGHLHRRLAPSGRRSYQDAHRRRSLAFCVTRVARYVLHKFANTHFQVEAVKAPRHPRSPLASKLWITGGTTHDACQQGCAGLADPWAFGHHLRETERP